MSRQPFKGTFWLRHQAQLQRMLEFLVAVLLFLICVAAAMAQQVQPPVTTCTVTITVLKPDGSTQEVTHTYPKGATLRLWHPSPHIAIGHDTCGDAPAG